MLIDYADVDFSSDTLMGRAFSPIAYADLTVGNVVNSFGLPNNDDPLSLANLLDPVAQYIIVNKAEDGSTDAVRGYTSCPAVAHFHPKLLTFVPIPGGVRQSVVLLSETPIRTRAWLSSSPQRGGEDVPCYFDWSISSPSASRYDRS